MIIAPLHYLATPYSRHPSGLKVAYMDAVVVNNRLAAKGFRVYAPIVHSHLVAKQTGVDPRDHDFWMACCEPWMRRCDVLLVARMNGWRDSVGIRMEIDAFKQAKKPVRYLDCETLSISEADI